MKLVFSMLTDSLLSSGTIPFEIDLLKIKGNGLDRGFEANLTNLFGISHDDFLSS